MKEIYQILMWIAAFVTFTLLCLIASGCKPSAAVSTQTDVQDSTRIEYRIVHDTIIQHDTVYINEKTVKDSETESEMTIHFGAGGGTYNSKTGDATNVTGVGTKESKREKEQKEHVERLISENTQLRHSLDSVRKVSTIMHSDTETKPVQTETIRYTPPFYRFTMWFFWIVVIGIVIYLAFLLIKKFYFR